MKYYQPTPLEQWVENLYRMHGITESQQLNIDEVSSQMNIWVYQLDQGSQTIDNNGLYSICIDRRLSKAEQWEDFLHELCHVVRHSGNQIRMPTGFLDMQETEAQLFVMYAALPYFMMPERLPDTDRDILNYFVEHLGVSYELADLRLDQIKRRRLRTMLDQVLRQQQAKVTPKKEQSTETKRVLEQLQRQIRRKGLKKNERLGLL